MRTVQGAVPGKTDREQPHCVEVSGFGVHAALRCRVDHCTVHKQFCLFITRPDLTNERVQAKAGCALKCVLRVAIRSGL
jgi:hypothetical protein